MAADRIFIDSCFYIGPNKILKPIAFTSPLRLLKGIFIPPNRNNKNTPTTECSLQTNPLSSTPKETSCLNRFAVGCMGAGAITNQWFSVVIPVH